MSGNLTSNHEHVAAIRPPAAIRASKRKALRVKWDKLPDWIRGPYRIEFDAVNALLDAGDDTGAERLIEYAEPRDAFTDSQKATFASVKAEFAAEIAALP